MPKPTTPKSYITLMSFLSALLVGLTLVGCGEKPKIQPAVPVIGADDLRRIDELERNARVQGTKLQTLFSMVEGMSTNDGMMGNLGSDTLIVKEIYFDNGEYDLSDSDKEMLDEIARKFFENRRSVIEIRGWCDQTGSDFSNQTLSNVRALSAARYLSRKWEVPLNQIPAIGMGVDDSSPAPCKQCRRVEVVLKSPKAQGNDAGSEPPSHL